MVVLLALAASMFGLWELRVPRGRRASRAGAPAFGGALVMGLVVGLVAAPCIGPFVLGLLTYVGQRQDVAARVRAVLRALARSRPALPAARRLRPAPSSELPNSGAWMLGVRQLFGVLC